MQIVYTDGIIVAGKVIEGLIAHYKTNPEILKVGLHPEREDETIYIEGYANGRENGFTLCCTDGIDMSKWYRIAICEYRKSDSICLYVGEYNQFKQGNIPSEEIYNDKIFFSYNEVKETVEWIINYIETH